MPSNESFEGWAILELMGHRRLGGLVSEITIAGSAMLRVDVHSANPDVAPVTQFYSSSAIYSLTPTTEAIARAFADGRMPEPVHRYEIPKLVLECNSSDDEDDRPFG